MEIVKNKYYTWYTAIIKNAKKSTRKKKDGRYYEKHHIVPRSLGGSNESNNLVLLTAREHYICHVLLIKFTLGYEKQKMMFALGKFIQGNKKQERNLTSRQYQRIRESISLARTGKKHSAESRQKMSNACQGRTPWNKGKKVGPHSMESNRKRSKTLKGKSFEERYGSERADEIRKKITKSKIGKPSGMLGKTHSDETKRKMKSFTHSDATKKQLSEMKKGIEFSEEHLANLKKANILNGKKRRGKQQNRVTCPYCGKIGGASGMSRYHFENCKFKKDS